MFVNQCLCLFMIIDSSLKFNVNHIHHNNMNINVYKYVVYLPYLVYNNLYIFEEIDSRMYAEISYIIRVYKIIHIEKVEMVIGK